MTRSSIPDQRKAEVARLSARAYTDEQIAVRLNCNRLTVLAFRQKHGILKQRGPQLPQASIRTPIVPIRTYFDAQVNHMVKVYAPGQANGDLPFIETEF